MSRCGKCLSRFDSLSRVFARAPIVARDSLLQRFRRDQSGTYMIVAALTMPVLAIGGEKSLGEVLGAQMKSVARDVTVIVLKNTGHWILEENTKETTDALTKFL